MSRDWATQAAFNWLTNDPETESWARALAEMGSDALKGEVENLAYDGQDAMRNDAVLLAGLFGDLLGGALARVDWNGLTRDILET